MVNAILEEQRWTFPEAAEKDENEFEKIAKSFIGGKFINKLFPTPRIIDIPADWIDIHSTALKLDHNFHKRQNLKLISL